MLLLLLAQLVEARLPSIGASEPDPAGLTYLVFREMRGDSLPERIIFFDHPASDVEGGGRKPGEAQIALRRGGRSFPRFRCLALASYLHRPLERALQQHGRRAHGTASSARISTLPPVPHQRHE